MANVYAVRSGAGGAGTGADWANAYTTLAAAFTAKAAGDDFWISEDHAETQASAMTCTSPGTNTSPCRAICVDHAGSVPPVSADLRTTATISTTGANNLSVTGVSNGSTYYRGIAFQAGDAANNARVVVPAAHAQFESCILKLNNTASSIIQVNGTFVEFINCTFTFAAVGQSITCTSNKVAIQGGSLSGTAPTTLFAAATSVTQIFVRGLDMSLLGSGKNITSNSGGVVSQFQFENCKLGASVTLSSGTQSNKAGWNRFVNCDSSATNYRYAYFGYQGTITQETTIVRSGGASDGTTPVSRKMVTNANSKLSSPLPSDSIVVWNDTTGSSKTATIEVVTDGVTLTDAEAWLEVEYLGDASFPDSSFVSDRSADILATGASQTSSSVTWTTTGLSSPVKQKLSISFTPQLKGPVKVRVMLAKASTTLYFCPKVDIT